jgi:hypothetical protein
MATQILHDDEEMRVVLRPKTRRGQPGRVDGIPVWSTSAPTVLDVVPEADGMAAVIRPVGLEGEGDVNVEADADLGAGVTPIIGTLHIKVPGGLATIIDLIPEPPTPQAPPVPEPPLP